MSTGCWGARRVTQFEAAVALLRPKLRPEPDPSQTGLAPDWQLENPVAATQGRFSLSGRRRVFVIRVLSIRWSLPNRDRYLDTA